MAAGGALANCFEGESEEVARRGNRSDVGT